MDSSCDPPAQGHEPKPANDRDGGAARARSSSIAVTPPAVVRRNPHAVACGALAVVLIATAAVGISTAALAIILCVAVLVGYAGAAQSTGPTRKPTGRDRVIIRIALPAASGLSVLGVVLIFAGEPSIGLLLGAAASAVLGIGSATANEPAAFLAAARTRPSTAHAATAIALSAIAVSLIIVLTTT